MTCFGPRNGVVRLMQLSKSMRDGCSVLILGCVCTWHFTHMSYAFYGLSQQSLCDQVLFVRWVVQLVLYW